MARNKLPKLDYGRQRELHVLNENKRLVKPFISPRPRVRSRAFPNSLSRPLPARPGAGLQFIAVVRYRTSSCLRRFSRDRRSGAMCVNASALSQSARGASVRGWGPGPDEPTGVPTLWDPGARGDNTLRPTAPLIACVCECTWLHVQC